LVSAGGAPPQIPLIEGAYCAASGPLAGFRGPTSKGEKGKWSGGEGKEGRGGKGSKEEGREEGREREHPSVPPSPNLPLHHCTVWYVSYKYNPCGG